jgi:death-on-curing family protein
MLRPRYLEYIHDALVSILWSGSEPIGERELESNNHALIESAAARPFQTVLGQDAYPTIIEKGVALFHSINANHAFMNGNKRTAVIAIDHFLTANDHILLLENDEMYAIAEKTAAYKSRGLSQDQSLAEILEALEENIVEVDIVERAVGTQPQFLKTIQNFRAIRDLVRRGCEEMRDK